MASFSTGTHDPVDIEKEKGQVAHFENVDIYDPDAGLSDEERAAIVRYTAHLDMLQMLTAEGRTRSLFGSWTER